MISPGVYTKIIDLSEFVQQVPGTIGCVCGLTKKGEDNVLKFIGSQSDFLSEFGEPNFEDYGLQYSQGPYIAYNFLGESGALYFMRCMPDDSSYANIRIDSSFPSADSTATISTTYVASSSSNNKDELQTALQTNGETKPICILYPIGRGEFYNSYSVRITEAANPLKNGVYNLDIYEVQSDKSEVIIESFEISFEPSAVDNFGGSLFIVDVLERYSKIMRSMMTLANGEYTDGYKLIVKSYDKNIDEASTVTLTEGSAQIQDVKQDFSDWETESGTAEYMIIVKDYKGNEIYGWLGETQDADGETIAVYDDKDLDTANQNWAGDISSFKTTHEITYEIKKAYASVETPFTAGPLPLKKGSDGTLISSTGVVDGDIAKGLLVSAYSGTLTKPDFGGDYEDKILDTDYIYFSMVFDAGYPSDVKVRISNLAVTRGDCIAITDNGDNQNYTASMTARENVNMFNNFYTAIYEPFNKVNDIFTGRDIWVSPIYHMSYILPRNDRLTEIWYAAAGFDYVIDSIKELRFSPKQGERDQMYLKQLNPLVKFREGIAPWGQLTSQSKPSAMQDINIVRLVLYCKVALERFCRYYIFKMNDSFTWDAVSREVTSFLDEIRRDRGLYSFNVEVGANEYEIKQKKFHVNVSLNPTRVSEKIELNFFIQ